MKIYTTKNNLTNFFTNVFFLIFLLFLISSKCESVENKILFKINNKIITSIDILDNLNYLKSTNPNFEKIDKNSMMSIASNELIRHRIKEIAVEQIKNQKIDEKLIEDVLISDYKNYNINSINDLIEYVGRYNIEIDYLKNRIKTNLLWNRLIFVKFSDQVIIDKDQIKNELSQNNFQNEYNLSEIIFSLDDNENLNQKSELIFNVIKKEGFDVAALKMSITESSKAGGNIGWVKENSLNKNVRESLKKIEKMNYTKPIVIPGGFLVLKINDIKKIEKFDNIDEAIEATVRVKTNEQLNQFSNIYFNKFRKDIKIEKL